MKSHTDIPQSKKLAEFLSLESADMCFLNDGTAIKANLASYKGAKAIWDKYYVEITPCWSLSALMAQLRWMNLYTSKDNHCRAFWRDVYSNWHDNAVDACVELLEKRVGKKEEEWTERLE